MEPHPSVRRTVPTLGGVGRRVVDGGAVIIGVKLREVSRVLLTSMYGGILLKSFSGGKTG